MPVYAIYFSSLSWNPIYSRTVLYKLMPAVVVYGKFNKYCACIIKILKFIIVIVEVHMVVRSMKYYKVIKSVYIV